MTGLFAKTTSVPILLAALSMMPPQLFARQPGSVPFPPQVVPVQYLLGGLWQDGDRFLDESNFGPGLEFEIPEGSTLHIQHVTCRSDTSATKLAIRLEATFSPSSSGGTGPNALYAVILDDGILSANNIATQYFHSQQVSVYLGTETPDGRTVGRRLRLVGLADMPLSSGGLSCAISGVLEE